MTAPHELHLRAMRLVRAIATSTNSLWLMTPAAVHVKAEAEAIINKAAEILDVPQPKFHKYPDTCSLIDGHPGPCDGGTS